MPPAGGYDLQNVSHLEDVTGMKHVFKTAVICAMYFCGENKRNNVSI